MMTLMLDEVNTYLHVVRNKFSLIKEQSKFVDWQRIKVQENADEVRRVCAAVDCPGRGPVEKRVTT
jgi:DNA replicative helicase MCM subunit Mcm2 (Cdc46/Mcm family)